MSRLEEIKMKVNNTSEPMLYVPYDDMNWLISRVERLEEEKHQDPRQGMLEDLHMENERYKQELTNLLAYANKQIERYTDRDSKEYSFERYDEVSDFKVMLETILEN